MVYKRFIEKNGKTYGPYIYHSKKVDGKVVSEYQGKGSVKKSVLWNSVFFGCVGIIFLMLVLLLVLNVNFTGNVSLSISKVYQVGENVEGFLKLSLEEGEFIPASTNVLIFVGENSYNYLLSELVDEDAVQGIFYVDGKNISGEGLGYGVSENYESVDFVLDVYYDEEVVEESEDDVEVVLNETEIVEEEEIIEEVVEDGESSGSSSGSEDVVPDETPVEEVSEEVVEEPVVEEVPEEEVPVEEVVEVSTKGKDVKEDKAEAKVSEKEDKKSEDVVESVSESEPVSITGEVIGSVFSFLESLTGNVIQGEEVSGSVSYGESFEYDLEEGQTAKLVSSSEDVEIEIKNKKVVVTTNYKNNEKKDLEINLTALNILAEDGDLEVVLSYEGLEIVRDSKKISVEDVEENFTLVNETILNETVLNVTFGNLTITTLQFDAVIGQPVKWKKNVKMDFPDEFRVQIHKEASNISVYKLNEVLDKKEINEIEHEVKKETKEETKEEINETEKEIKEDLEEEQVVKEMKKEKITAEIISSKVSANINLNEESFFKKTWEKIISAITGRVIDIEETEEIKEVVINEDATEFDIEYETPAPVSFESNLSNGKEIIISSDVHYENILAYTELENEVSSLSSIKLYHLENGSRILTQFEAHDLNNNSLMDSIFWVVPHLSNQTYQLIIEISKAEHLDTNRTFISDIYESVKALDGNYSEVINDGEYVRVTFEIPLDSSRDITIYPRGNGSVEVYEMGGEELIADFGEIVEEKNTIYLNNLNGTQDVFDLKVVGGSLEFDWIVDPYAGPELTSVILNSTNPLSNNTYQNLTVYTDQDGNASLKMIRDWRAWEISKAVINSPFESNNSGGVGLTKDYSTYSNNGTVTGASWNSVAGYDGKGAYTFDGVNDNINFGYKNYFVGNTTFTIMSWIKPIQVKSIMSIVETREATVLGWGWYLDDIGANYNLAWAKLGGSSYISSGTLPANQWTHIVTTYDGSKHHHYINGIESGTGSAIGNATDSAKTMKIGYSGNVARLFNGTIDEFVFLNYSLSSEQINAVYNNRTDVIVSQETSVGENWTACVTPNDGYNDGEELCSNNVEILANFIPNATNVILNSTNVILNDTFQNLTGYWIFSDDDVEDVEVLNETRWYNNSVEEVSLKNFTIVDAGNTTYGDIWIFSVRVYDGIDWSGWINSSELVILDLTYPSISILYPTNNTNSSDTGLNINYTASDLNVGSCWYSNDTYLINTTLADCGTNITDVVWSEGNHNVTVWINDTAGNTNSSSVSFRIDTISAGLVIIVPVNNSNFNSSSVEFNVSSSEALSWCGLSIDLGANETMTAFNTTYYNYTNTTMTQGYHNIRITCNDSAGNYNSSIVNNILVDTIYPDISYDVTTSANLSSVRDLIVNISSNDSGDSYVVNNLDNSVVGWWRFEQSNSSGTLAVDEMGKKNGSVNGRAPWTQAGKFGKTYEFNGVNQSITIGTTPSPNNISWTISAWTKSNSGGASNQEVIGKGSSSPGGSGFHLYYASSKFYLYYYKVGTAGIQQTIFGNASLPNNWYHVSIVYNGSDIIKYLNGSQDSSVNIGTFNPNNNYILYIGTGLGYFNGTIDDVIIFNRSLSAGEISSLYNASATKYYNNFSGQLTDGTHTFTGYVVDKGGNLNVTDTRTITIDNSYPQISITSPLNNTNWSDINLDVNYTYTELNVGSCWYTNNSGAVNNTLTCGNNITGVSWLEGINNVTIYMNDSAGNTNSSSVMFYVDTINPDISIITPINNTNSSNNNLDINYTTSDIGLGISSCWYSNDSMSINNTIICGENITSMIWADGGHNVTIYVNDSVNNLNWSSVTFLVDTTSPSMNITEPQNTSYAVNVSWINYTYTELNLGSCWYSTDTGATNSSAVVMGTNFTDVISVEGSNNWIVYYNDSVGNQNSTNVTFYKDSLIPVVSLITPADAYSSTTATISFTYNVTDASSANCSLIINGVVWNFNSSVDIFGNTNQFDNTTAVGSYTWSVNCSDELNNVGNSSVRNFTITSVPPVSPTGGGGGSVGGSETIAVVEENPFVVQDSYETTISLNHIEDDKISIENTGLTPRVVNVQVLTIQDILILDESQLTIDAESSKDLTFRLTPPKEPGIYVGKIIISSESFQETVLVSINVKTEKSLFDIIMSVINEDKRVRNGENLSVQIDLLQMGIREKMDVTLEYVLKDFDGKNYFTESETIAVDTQKTLMKDFSVDEIPNGDYVLGVQLVYPDGVAVASSQIKIGEDVEIGENNVMITSLILALVILAGGISFMTVRHRRMIKKIKSKKI